ncbi:MAG TPA: SDR family oxidoreductase [Gemmatimonadaceae bacterium]|nr:SDR family oxidoreductase [Gemmatimonadaceae bacterium]
MSGAQPEEHGSAESRSGVPEHPAHPLAGKVVLVTGASSGIGRAIAFAAAGAGADVAITYRSSAGAASEAAALIEGAGRRAAVFQADMSEAGDIEALAHDAREWFGRIDVWVNNAGADILTGEGATLSTVEKLDRLLAVDLRGSILASWTAVELMRAQPGGGTIINMSWDHVLAGMEGRNPQMFSAVKGGVLSFSKSLARSVAPEVRVNIIAPGWIETSFGAGLEPERYRAVADSTPLRRWGTPEDVARAVVWLASPDAAFLTGQMVMVNGGVVM